MFAQYVNKVGNHKEAIECYDKAIEIQMMLRGITNVMLLLSYQNRNTEIFMIDAKNRKTKVNRKNYLKG